MKITQVGLENINEIVNLIWNVQIEFNQIPNMFQNNESKEFFENSVLKKMNDKLVFYGAYLDDTLIGVIGFEGNSILYLYVLKEYQKMGVGTLLLRYALELLKRYESIIIDSVDESKEFYRKIGFNEIENDYDITMEYKRKTS